jgi:GAF domain-containing protein
MIEGLGGLPPVPLEQRLARIAVSLTNVADRAEISTRAVQAAIEISGMSSAALSEINDRGEWEVCSSAGPLSAALRRWTHAEHEVIAQWVGAGTSSHFPGGTPVPPDYAFLLRDDVHAIAVQPLVAGGSTTGLLTTADTQPRPHQPAVVAAKAADRNRYVASGP